MFAANPFHQALQFFAQSNQNSPILHIDIHGKADREDCDVDVGIKSIEEHWGSNDPLL